LYPLFFYSIHGNPPFFLDSLHSRGGRLLLFSFTGDENT
jgi:hypothetical protein